MKTYCRGRRLKLLRAALLAAVACGGPLPNSEPANAEGANAATAPTDAGSTAMAPMHAMTILNCSASDACGRPDATDSLTSPAGGGYRVATGSGNGLARSREQALSDIYREIRDRTSFGTKLVAVSHHEGHPGPTRATGEGPKAGGTDPLILASFEILEAVDREGRVTLDVFHGRTSCKVALAMTDLDAGGRRCLVDGPEHGSSHEDPVTPREREKRFGL